MAEIKLFDDGDAIGLQTPRGRAYVSDDGQDAWLITLEFDSGFRTKVVPSGSPSHYAFLIALRQAAHG